MDFYELVDQVANLLRQRGKLTYRSLRRQFDLDDEALDDLKEELFYTHPVIDDEGRGLVWRRDTAQETTPTTGQTEQPIADQERAPSSYIPPHLAEKILNSRRALEGARKQVTVMFCDLANSTALAKRIGPLATDENGRVLVWTGDPAVPETEGSQETDVEARFYAVLPVLTGLLQREGRVTYRTLMQIFSLDERLLGHLREDLVLKLNAGN